jgi:hypothetical protein
MSIDLLQHFSNNPTIIGGSDTLTTTILEQIETGQKPNTTIYNATETFLRKINSGDYEEYLDNLYAYYNESTINNKNYTFSRNLKGELVKETKPDSKLKNIKYTVTPPKYQTIPKLLIYLNNVIDDTLTELNNVRDDISNTKTSTSSVELRANFDKIQIRYNNYIIRKEILENYTTLVNGDTSAKINDLLLAKTRNRTAIRLLFKEITNISQIKPLDTRLYQQKIEEYLHLDSINNIDRDIKKLTNTDQINYYIETLPKTTLLTNLAPTKSSLCGSSNNVKKDIKKTKKRKIVVRKPKQKGGDNDLVTDKILLQLYTIIGDNAEGIPDKDTKIITDKDTKIINICVENGNENENDNENGNDNENENGGDELGEVDLVQSETVGGSGEISDETDIKTINLLDSMSSIGNDTLIGGDELEEVDLFRSDTVGGSGEISDENGIKTINLIGSYSSIGNDKLIGGDELEEVDLFRSDTVGGSGEISDENDIKTINLFGSASSIGNDTNPDYI